MNKIGVNYSLVKNKILPLLHHKSNQYGQKTLAGNSN